MREAKVRIATRVVLVALACLLVVAPLQIAPYRTAQLSLVMVYAIVGYGLNVLTGWAGKVSLGHTFFFALGAYCAALLEFRAHWPEPSAAAAAIAICAVTGYALGRPILRFTGLQLALATIALAVLTPVLIRRLHSFTGGEEGMPVQPTSFLSWTGLAPDQQIYYLCLTGVTISLLVYLWSRRGLVGAALRATAEHDTVARSLGINTTSLKSQAFAMSAALTGGAGFCFGKAVGYLGGESFGLLVAISFLTLVVVGGFRSALGPWLGAVFLVYVPDLAADVNQSAPAVLYGAILLVAVAALPAGVAGIGAQLSRHISKEHPAT